jgi:hypothetical protein
MAVAPDGGALRPEEVTGDQFEALARALVAAAPGADDLAAAGLGPPAAEWRALMHVQPDRRLPEVFATMNTLFAEIDYADTPGLIVALVALASEVLHRLAGALDRPLADVRAEIFAEMAAWGEGLGPPD